MEPVTSVPSLKPAALRYGTLTLPSRWLLSPLAGFTNLSFRRVVRELGGLGLGTTDLVNARALLAGNQKSLRLTETSPDDTPYAVQIFGSDVLAMCAAAQLLEERGVDSVDINMGCPVDRITRSGSGAGLMCGSNQTIALVRSVVEAVKIPVTVKMRLGWDETQITAPDFAREFEQVGVAAIAIHGRTREQGFGGDVNHAGIRAVVEAVESIPVIGNGDVRSVSDAAHMLCATGCQGVSIGRGALANPWVFRQLDQWERTGRFDPPGNFEQRLLLLRRQMAYLEQSMDAHWAIISFRKTAHWYLKAMRVRAALRHSFQQARTKQELEAVLTAISEEGPVRGSKTGLLPKIHVPVPSGPVEKW